MAFELSTDHTSSQSGCLDPHERLCLDLLLRTAHLYGATEDGPERDQLRAFLIGPTCMHERLNLSPEWGELVVARIDAGSKTSDPRSFIAANQATVSPKDAWRIAQEDRKRQRLQDIVEKSTTVRQATDRAGYSRTGAFLRACDSFGIEVPYRGVQSLHLAEARRKRTQREHAA